MQKLFFKLHVLRCYHRRNKKTENLLLLLHHPLLSKKINLNNVEMDLKKQNNKQLIFKTKIMKQNNQNKIM